MRLMKEESLVNEVKKRAVSNTVNALSLWTGEVSVKQHLPKWASCLPSSQHYFLCLHTAGQVNLHWAKPIIMVLFLTSDWLVQGHVTSSWPIGRRGNQPRGFWERFPSLIMGLYLEGSDGEGNGGVGGSKRRGYMYTYGWFMLRFDRKQHNSVKQFTFNKN